MADRTRPGAQQRRSYRTTTGGPVMVHVQGMVVRSRCLNLSLGGVLVEWRDQGRPRPAVGTLVSVQLEVGDAGWLEQRGHVQRCDAGQLAIGFDALSADTEDRIEDRVLAALEAERVPRLLIIDPFPPRRQLIAALLARAGYCSIEASMPIDALQQLQRPQLQLVAVAIAETATQTGRDELIGFLSEAHPGLPVILIGARAYEAVRAVVARLAGHPHGPLLVP